MFIIMSLESRFIIFNVIINFYFCASTFFVCGQRVQRPRIVVVVAVCFFVVVVFTIHTSYIYIVVYDSWRYRLRLIITCAIFSSSSSRIDFTVFALRERARAR